MMYFVSDLNLYKLSAMISFMQKKDICKSSFYCNTTVKSYKAKFWKRLVYKVNNTFAISLTALINDPLCHSSRLKLHLLTLSGKLRKIWDKVFIFYNCTVEFS